MNFTISGHHLEITPAIREYITTKLERVLRHFDHITRVNVILTIEKLIHKCEASAHVQGKEIHISAHEEDMYAAIDAMTDKLDRQIVKYKEKQRNGLHQTKDSLLTQQEDNPL